MWLEGPFAQNALGGQVQGALGDGLDLGNEVEIARVTQPNAEKVFVDSDTAGNAADVVGVKLFADEGKTEVLEGARASSFGDTQGQSAATTISIVLPHGHDALLE